MQGAPSYVGMGKAGWGTQDNGMRPKVGLDRCYYGGKSAKRTSGIYNTGSGKAILVAAHNPEARKENIHKN